MHKLRTLPRTSYRGLQTPSNLGARSAPESTRTCQVVQEIFDFQTRPWLLESLATGQQSPALGLLLRPWSWASHQSSKTKLLGAKRLIVCYKNSMGIRGGRMGSSRPSLLTLQPPPASCHRAAYNVFDLLPMALLFFTILNPRVALHSITLERVLLSHAVLCMTCMGACGVFSSTTCGGEKCVGLGDRGTG